MSKQHPHAPVSPKLAIGALIGLVGVVVAVVILLVACEGVG